MSKFLNEKYQNLQEVAEKYRDSYVGANPYPHINFENFFNPDLLDEVLEEFPDLSKQEDIEHFDNPREKKFAGKGEKSFGPVTWEFMHFLNSEPFLEFLQHLTGIEEKLLGDPYYHGGGLHEIKRGGLLKIHTDFMKHPSTGLDRRINVLVYLNKEWKEEYGGHFELWDREMKQCEKKVLPEFNTLTIFSTSGYSYHGHPNPLTCPEDRSRKSLALYYYSNGRPEEEVNRRQGLRTTFRARAGHDEDMEAIPDQRQSLGGKVKYALKQLTPPILLHGWRRLRGW